MLDDAELLHLNTTFDGATATLRAEGELDIYTANRLVALAEQLCTRQVAEIVVDGDNLSFVDSAGLRALVVAHDRAQVRGIDLRVGAASDALGKVLAMTGLDGLLQKQP